MNDASRKLKPAVIVDYGMGNIGSVRNMILKLGGTVEISSDPNLIEHSQHVILPGVGSFDAGAAALKSRGLDRAVINSVSNNNNLLGVCLGMQLLLERSDEGSLSGLGLISGSSKRFPETAGGRSLRIPHMGWNTLTVESDENALPSLGEDGSRYYFVHSYYAKPTSEKNILTMTSYGIEFASSIFSNRVIGVQFHPEKSHRHGLRLLTDFLSIEGDRA